MSDTRLVDNKATFSSFSHILDVRILRALADLGFARPTLVQTKAIPLALDNRDILARARTGSGKTAAYCIPLVQKVLNAKVVVHILNFWKYTWVMAIRADGRSRRRHATHAVSGNIADTPYCLQNPSQDDRSSQVTRGLILVPTRELSEQVSAHLTALLAYCEREVKVVNVSAGTSIQLQRTLLSDNPDIVVATPSRALALLQSKTFSLSSLDTLVIDEADLILSYGHDEDVRQIFNGGYLPKVFQSFLMSATMTEDVEALKGLALRNPAILKLEEDEDEAANLTQYSVRCSEVDKFLLTYVILKLRLIKGKCILFVNDVDRCYRLKLFLEQFSIKSCVLNSELPLNSRYHAVQEFNKGVYDYIIASDESAGRAELDSEDEQEEQEEGGGEVDDEFTSTQREPQSQKTAAPSDGAAKTDQEQDQASSSRPLKRKRDADTPADPSSSKSSKSSKRKNRHRNDAEYGVSRGVDFIDVSCVINFDLPSSARAYTHRVGRTARAGRTGMSLSFVVPREQWGKNKVVGCVESAKQDDKVFARIEREQGARGSQIREYKFDMKQVEAFRYRMEDALRSVTRIAIKEARIKELKTEILNSEKLKAHFEDNPLDLEYLRHDKPLRPTRIQPHMKHVPKYLLPRIAPVNNAEGTPVTDTGNVNGGDPGYVPFNKNSSRGRGRGRGRGGRGGSSGRGKKRSDPLKKFGR